MSELKKCRACGVDVQQNAPFGHCPKCLLELGFGKVPNDTPGSADDFAFDSSQSESGIVRQFGDYELLECIGHGGMGIVYKARQVSLNRTVALKMIRAGTHAPPAAVQRFQIEAEAAAKLDHPNIVPIHQIGIYHGQHFFSMKFVEGRNLAQEMSARDGSSHEAGIGRVADGTPSMKSAVRQQQTAAARLMATIARSVHYAHQHGVLHRDLKPSNILLDPGGHPYLTDFGLAKILEHDVGVSGSKDVFGTLSYMSPEQAAGARMTTATDVYSLGGILYELLTGRPPFLGATYAEIFQQLAEREPSHPCSVNPRLDRDLATICLRCLEKDPLRRYRSAGDMADDLERWLRHEPILARRASVVLRARRWTRRNPAVATLLVVLSAALAGTLVFLQILKDQDQEKSTALAIKERALQVITGDLKARLDALSAATVESVIISAESRALLTSNETATVASGKERRFKFGIYVHKESPMERLFTFAPLLKRLDEDVSKRLKQSVRTDFVVFRSYTAAMDALLKGEVDFVRFGASSYVIAKDKDRDVSILAAQKHEDFNGVIFTQASNREIQTLRDLKGKTLALGHTNSTTGSQLARCFLAENGFHAKDFSNLATNYLANHAAVIAAITRREFDAGAAKESFVEKDPNLRIIGKYPNIGMVWVARPNLEAKANQAIRACLLATSSDLVRGLEDEVTGFEEKTDADYTTLRKKMAEAAKFDESKAP